MYIRCSVVHIQYVASLQCTSLHAHVQYIDRDLLLGYLIGGIAIVWRCNFKTGWRVYKFTPRGISKHPLRLPLFGTNAPATNIEKTAAGEK